MPSDIEYLHHVGMVVEDIGVAVERYQSFGFAIEPPSFPALPADDGALEPLGAAQTTARFARNFIEIVAVVPPGAALPPSATLVPIQAPPDRRDQVRQVVEQTMAGFTAMLADHEGLHRLVFSAADVDLVAARLDAAGVRHSGVTITQRPVDDGGTLRVETIRHLEITAVGVEATAEETLLAVAERESLHGRTASVHPNGATGVIEAVLCVAPEHLAGVVARYETYLDRAAVGAGDACRFDLDGAAFTVLTAAEHAARLPGETPAALPALVAYAVAVPDQHAIATFLADRGVPVAQTAAGEPFIPARAGLGTAIIFRAAG